MGKVLFPAYFPLTTNCDSIEGWGGLSLEMAMAAYWKVKSWQVSFEFTYPDEPFVSNKKLTQTFSVTSPHGGIPVTAEEQLVCDLGGRGWDFDIPEAPPDYTNAFSNANFFMYSDHWGFGSNFTEFGELFFPYTTSEFPIDYILPITITIGNLTTVLEAAGGDDGSGQAGEGKGSITAVEFWPYSD